MIRTHIHAAATAVAIALAGTASVALTRDGVIDSLSGQGFTRIEVKEGPTQMKVEAIRGTEKLEIVYDRASGDIVKREMERVRRGEDTRPGVEVSREDRDFVRNGADDGDRDRGRRGRDRADRDDDDNDGDRGRGRDDDDDDDYDDDGDDDHGGRGGDNDDDHDDGDDDDHGGDDDGDDDDDDDGGRGSDDD